jgi:uncharacterized protein (TIGR03086 family)
VDDLEALRAAGAELARRLPAVREEDLDRPSACPGWSVFDLVNHVIGGGHRYLLLMQGAATADLAPTRTEDHVHPDPLAQFRRWEEPLAAALAEPGALDRVVHHPVGDRPGRYLLRMRYLDLALHAWDLARSLGLGEDLDPDLAAHLLAHGLPVVEELRDAGYYAAERPDGPATGDPVAELPRRTGRG